MTVTFLIGDVREQLRRLPAEHFDCVVTSPPYWGLRDYEVDGQIGLERTLGEHLAVMVDVFREVRRVLKRQGTLWLNYGDCYAAAPNGKSAAAYKADGTDDRTFRDKPFSTVGPIFQRDRHGDRGERGNVHRRKAGVTAPGAIVAGGYLKPKDLCMIPNRLAIALQDDGWWVRSEIIWHKPNPMPESVYDRPTVAHEKVWLLTKSEDYFYNHEAIREPVTGGTHARKPGPNSRQHVDRVPRSRKVVREDNPFSKSKASFAAATAEQVDTRNARNVWKIAPKAYREAHFATFPPALAERCIRAGVPLTTCSLCGSAQLPEDCGGMCSTIPRQPGRVLDPFGGAGTVGLVAEQLGLDCTLIELNPGYAEMARRRIYGSAVTLEAAE
ncbi:DNA-methyltransferase [Labrys neptuniae]